MVEVRVLDKEEFSEFMKYLASEGLVIVKKEIADKFGITDGSYNYDFGGEADYWLDIVSDENHLFIDKVKEEK